MKDEPTEQRAVEIFRYLVIQNRDTLRPYFREVPFVNNMYDSPAMKEIMDVLQSETGMNLREELSQLINQGGIQHENLNVKMSALKTLRKVLQEKASEIVPMVLGDSVDPLVAQLVKSLLVGCREQNRAVKLLYSECLGELGAIDPGRLDIVIKPEIMKDKDDVEMAQELIQDYLVKAYRASATKSQDRSVRHTQSMLVVPVVNIVS
jgi:serine/threonine-protein kinase ATR